MLKLFQENKVPFLIAAIVAVMFGSFAYDLVRTDFIKLFTLYGGLFGLTYYLVSHFGGNLKLIIGLGILYRLVLLLALPNLSQDFYRFLWDGTLVLQGGNPYLFTPESYLANPELFEVTIANAQELYQGMGTLNGSHFSNYPPVKQFCFALASLLGGKSILGGVLVLRLLIIAADIGILYFGVKLLKRLQLPIQNVFFYYLNPFIIIELTGNLHFEGIMLFFFLSGFYALLSKKYIWSAVLIAISISIKLIPLLFLPLFIQLLWKREDSTATNVYRTVGFYTWVLAAVVFIFLPYLTPEVFYNYAITTALWFQNFEFNASIYYVVRWIGFQTVGWNVIETAGKVLPVLVFGFILILSFFRKNNTPQSFLTALLFAISIYFLLSTTVHPWYLATPLLLSVFTKYRFPLLLSFLVILSYAAYHMDGVQENLVLVTVEYVLAIGFAIWEIVLKSPRKQRSIPVSQNI
jgi:alpha-1,6-mannosyltransferase